MVIWRCLGDNISTDYYLTGWTTHKDYNTAVRYKKEASDIPEFISKGRLLTSAYYSTGNICYWFPFYHNLKYCNIVTLMKKHRPILSWFAKKKDLEKYVTCFLFAFNKYNKYNKDNKNRGNSKIFNEEIK